MRFHRLTVHQAVAVPAEQEEPLGPAQPADSVATIQWQCACVCGAQGLELARCLDWRAEVQPQQMEIQLDSQCWRQQLVRFGRERLNDVVVVGIERTLFFALQRRCFVKDELFEYVVSWGGHWIDVFLEW